MIVLTICETTVLAVHLSLFLLLFLGDPVHAAGCDTTYAVLRLPFEAVYPHAAYSPE
jgi:hypothetical protein